MRSRRVPLRRLALASLALTLALAGCTTHDDGTPPTDVPATAALGTPGPSPSTTPTADKPKTPKPKIDRAALNYFFKIALGAEYGDDIHVVTRWMKPVVTVRVAGKPSAADRDCLGRVVSDFNRLTATTDLKLTTSATADIRVHFAPVSRFKSLEPNYVPDNDGFFHVDWSAGYIITNANVLIRTTGISPRIRCHLIREELTQSTGLMRDADDHPSSVFYGQYWSAPTRYSALDQKLIKLLYGGAIQPGDTKKMITAAVTVS
ncbi:DUF2927 domain-containing protein [Couchioplanes caeruleus]|uniref:DUF2927 domain-containing protein n=1 Tax=Couchioplanes caeruleus TaxID=56438 RepID=UPI0020BE9E7F|nr:DUF2927 domain-containing protein [Couchioplanes caeruleus]UQU63364.1 DUF2927 domain-containing protein [Couchioplanes caeruleus]